MYLLITNLLLIYYYIIILSRMERMEKWNYEEKKWAVKELNPQPIECKSIAGAN